MDYIKENIYYLNLKEIKKICEKYNIPYNVYFKYKSKLYKSGIMLRKGKVLKNILRTLDNQKVAKYIIPEINVNYDSSYSLNSNVYFGHYKWTLAKKYIFPEYFKPVITQLMLYDLWKRNETFTYKQFIKYYDKYYNKYENLDHPEWKWINDKDKVDWKNKRNKIAKKMIGIIDLRLH